MKRSLALLIISCLLIRNILSSDVDPCKRQPFRGRCPVSGNGIQARSQFVLRYYLRNGECVSYPYGHCANDENEPKLFRYKEECQDACLNKKDDSNIDDSESQRRLAPKKTFSTSVPDEQTYATNKPISQSETPVILSECEKQRSNGDGFKLECDIDGNYKALQCNADKQECFCVDAAGKEVPYSRSQPDGVAPDCSAIAKAERRLTDKCTGGPSYGPCKANLTKWYFDDNENICKTFQYSGCGTNGNIYENELSCKDRCVKRKTTTSSETESHTTIPQADRNTICSLPKERGPCDKYDLRFYYNKELNECKYFFFGGCEGNQNNFLKVEDCEATCGAKPAQFREEIPKKPEDVTTGPKIVETLPTRENSNRFTQQTVPQTIPPRVLQTTTEFPFTENRCTPPKDPGHCSGNFVRWFWNSERKICETFSYSGCGGNSNNFANREECLSVCHINAMPKEAEPETLNPFDVCSHKIDPGECGGNFLRFAFDKQSGQCVKLRYTGCMGNGNNFATEEDCARKCLPNRKPVQQSPACFHPIDIGDCEGVFPRFGYDRNTNECKKYIYSGCNGSPNNFGTYQDCADSCIRSPCLPLTNCDLSRCHVTKDERGCPACSCPPTISNPAISPPPFPLSGNKIQINCPIVDAASCIEPCMIFSNRKGCQECVCPQAPTSEKPSSTQSQVFETPTSARQFVRPQQPDERQFARPQPTLQNTEKPFIRTQPTLPETERPTQTTSRFETRPPSTHFTSQSTFESTSGSTFEPTFESTFEPTLTPHAPSPPAPPAPKSVEIDINSVDNRNVPVAPTFTDVVGDKCTLPVDPGPCKNFIERWYFNIKTGTCEPFKFGGCGGSRNHFFTRHECEVHCARFANLTPLPHFKILTHAPFIKSLPILRSENTLNNVIPIPPSIIMKQNNENNKVNMPIVKQNQKVIKDNEIKKNTSLISTQQFLKIPIVVDTIKKIQKEEERRPVEMIEEGDTKEILEIKEELVSRGVWIPESMMSENVPSTTERSIFISSRLTTLIPTERSTLISTDRSTLLPNQSLEILGNPNNRLMWIQNIDTKTGKIDKILPNQIKPQIPGAIGSVMWVKRWNRKLEKYELINPSQYAFEEYQRQLNNNRKGEVIVDMPIKNTERIFENTRIQSTTQIPQIFVFSTQDVEIKSTINPIPNQGNEIVTEIPINNIEPTRHNLPIPEKFPLNTINSESKPFIIKNESQIMWINVWNEETQKKEIIGVPKDILQKSTTRIVLESVTVAPVKIIKPPIHENVSQGFDNKFHDKIEEERVLKFIKNIEENKEDDIIIDSTLSVEPNKESSVVPVTFEMKEKIELNKDDGKVVTKEDILTIADKESSIAPVTFKLEKEIKPTFKEYTREPINYKTTKIHKPTVYATKLPDVSPLHTIFEELIIADKSIYFSTASPEKSQFSKTTKDVIPITEGTSKKIIKFIEPLIYESTTQKIVHLQKETEVINSDNEFTSLSEQKIVKNDDVETTTTQIDDVKTSLSPNTHKINENVETSKSTVRMDIIEPSLSLNTIKNDNIESTKATIYTMKPSLSTFINNNTWTTKSTVKIDGNSQTTRPTIKIDTTKTLLSLRTFEDDNSINEITESVTESRPDNKLSRVFITKVPPKHNSKIVTMVPIEFTSKFTTKAPTEIDLKKLDNINVLTKEIVTPYFINITSSTAPSTIITKDIISGLSTVQPTRSPIKAQVPISTQRQQNKLTTQRQQSKQTSEELVDICNLPADAGHCFNYAPRWYFNSQIGKCEQFSYGSCGGNKNNFFDRQSCEAKCSPVIIPKVVASLPRECTFEKDEGFGGGYHPKYYFNFRNLHCEQMIYQGQGGNENRFDNKIKCENSCINVDGSNIRNEEIKPKFVVQPPRFVPESKDGETFGKDNLKNSFNNDNKNFKAAKIAQTADRLGNTGYPSPVTDVQTEITATANTYAQYNAKTLQPESTASIQESTLSAINIGSTVVPDNGGYPEVSLVPSSAKSSESTTPSPVTASSTTTGYETAESIKNGEVKPSTTIKEIETTPYEVETTQTFETTASPQTVKIQTSEQQTTQRQTKYESTETTIYVNQNINEVEIQQTIAPIPVTESVPIVTKNENEIKETVRTLPTIKIESIKEKSTDRQTLPTVETTPEVHIETEPPTQPTEEIIKVAENIETTRHIERILVSSTTERVPISPTVNIATNLAIGDKKIIHPPSTIVTTNITEIEDITSEKSDVKKLNIKPITTTTRQQTTDEEIATTPLEEVSTTNIELSTQKIELSTQDLTSQESTTQHLTTEESTTQTKESIEETFPHGGQSSEDDKDLLNVNEIPRKDEPEKKDEYKTELLNKNIISKLPKENLPTVAPSPPSKHDYQNRGGIVAGGLPNVEVSKDSSHLEELSVTLHPKIPVCPNKKNALADRFGHPLSCLPGKQACPTKSACIYNGVNFYCCPSSEDPYDHHVFGGYNGEESKNGYKPLAKTLNILSLSSNRPINRVKRESLGLDHVYKSIRFEGAPVKQVSRANRLHVNGKMLSICTLEVSRGNCEESHIRYFYDARLDQCRMFYFSGCQGNGNNFATQSDCERLCKAKVEEIKSNVDEQKSSIKKDICGVDKVPFGGENPLTCGNGKDSIGCPVGYECRNESPFICCPKTVEESEDVNQLTIKDIISKKNEKDSASITKLNKPYNPYKSNLPRLRTQSGIVVASSTDICPDGSDSLKDIKSGRSVDCGTGGDGHPLCPVGYYCSMDSFTNTRLCCQLGSIGTKLHAPVNESPFINQRKANSGEVVSKPTLPIDANVVSTTPKSSEPLPIAIPSVIEKKVNTKTYDHMMIKPTNRANNQRELVVEENPRLAIDETKEVGIKHNEDSSILMVDEIGTVESKIVADKTACHIRPSEGRACREDEPSPRTNLQYFYSIKDKKCKLFFYRGCGGSINRFESKKACEALCMMD
uniref:Kunitz/Bovine pancreatic trypsin inhibitor domain protein n=1 Tax=Parastrongyloides trichosuri TaxID=131310 RepID=A0A0N4Z460_PARTI